MKTNLTTKKHLHLNQEHKIKIGYLYILQTFYRKDLDEDVMNRLGNLPKSKR